MRHNLRQCKVCGQTFVDRAEIAETCFDCRSSESLQVPAASPGLSSSSLEVSSSCVGPSSSSPGLSSASHPVVLGTAAPQLTAADSGPPPEGHSPRDPLKLWQEDAKEVVSPAKTRWVSPPFKVNFEDHGDLDESVAAPPPRLVMRARYKIILAGAILLFYFIWPITPLQTPEDQEDQIALNESPPAIEGASQQPDIVPEKEQPEQPADAQEK